MTDDRKYDGRAPGQPLTTDVAGEETGSGGTNVFLPNAQWPLFKKAVAVAVEVDVMNRGDGKTGAGVVISKSGLVLTAWHVVQGAKKIRIRRMKLDRKTSKLVVAKKRHVCELVYADHRADVAVIKMRRPPRNLRVSVLGDSAELKKDSPLYRVGRDDVPIASGYLMSFDKCEGIDEIAVGMPAYPGSSGGPLFDIKGRVVAIALRANADEKLPPCSYAIPINVVVRRLLNRHAIRELLGAPPDPPPSR